MERRQFLTLGGQAALLGAGGLVVGGLHGCGGGSGAAAPSPAPAPAPTPAPAPGPGNADWDSLARQLQGQVLRPGQADFDRVARAANARYDALQPQGLVRCASAADIATALAFARQQNLRFAARSGGHSYTGASSGGGLLIDVGPLGGVQLDGERATVGAGAKLSDVYETLISAGRCIPSGSCVSVGISGITLGGGFGVVDRAYGLGCDALVAARVVTADGQLLDCSEQQRPDLFWALRGGGGGQVGIVSSFTFNTHAVSPLTQFSAQFDLNDLTAVLTAWQAWPQTMPDQIWSQLVLAPSGSVYLWGIAVGDAAFTTPHWEGLLARIARPPSNRSVQARSYRDVMLGSCGNLSRAQCHLPSQNASGVLGRAAMAASSDFFNAPLDAAGIAALAKALQQRREAGRAGSVIFNLMGGAVGRVPVDATAFPHRRALFSAQYLAEYQAGTPAATLEDAAQWTHGMRATMQAWSSGGAYVNYLDGLLLNPAEAYYGSNLAKLTAVKQTHDPAQVFKPGWG